MRRILLSRLNYTLKYFANLSRRKAFSKMVDMSRLIFDFIKRPKTLGFTTSGYLLSFALMSKKTEDGSLKGAISKSDQLYECYAIDALYDYLKGLLNNDSFSNQPDVLWRLARALYEKSKSSSQFTGSEKQQILREALGYVEKAANLDDNNFAVHKWFGILLQEISAFEGTKELIKKSFLVKEHFLKATELNPNDATCWHLLGLWYFKVAETSWLEKRIAAVVFAKPPEATFEEAFKFFEKAETISPNFYSQNTLYLAKTCLHLKKDDLAKEYLLLTLRFVCVTASDKEAHDEAYKILNLKGWKTKD